MSALVELGRFQTRTEAELTRLFLASAGIESVLFDAEMNSYGWGPMMPVRMMVLDEDLDLARSLLAEDDGAPPGPRSAALPLPARPRPHRPRRTRPPPPI
ncbi:MAG TPA: DUF2007 domain-containing protein [Sphingomicrobium sp.]|nr:DUF2007 domain-containing protein [Sphingomicrobium sp.]